MKKTIKGALAATAAGTLLLGGAGTLAYWTDAGTVGGGTVTSGHLKLTPTGAQACTAWTIDGTPGTFNPAVDKIVPGDVLSRSCSYTVSMAGKHITANLAVSDLTGTWGGTANALTGASATTALQKSVVFKKNTTAISASPVVIANTDVITADLTLTFPTTADNTTNVSGGLAATLNDITITATQAHSS